MALLPAIAIQAYNEFDQRRARILEVQSQALSLAKLTAANSSSSSKESAKFWSRCQSFRP